MLSPTTQGQVPKMASYTSKVIAVLGRTLRAGRWKLAEDTLVISFFGRCVLDLTRAYVDDEDDELTMSVFAAFGSVSILLPPGCDVEPSGVAIVASSDVEIPSDRPEDITKTSLAPLDVSWLALFAKVRVAEVRSASELVAASPTTAVALDPPSAEVFGGAGTVAPIASGAVPPSLEPASAVQPDASAEPEPASIETTAPFDDAESQAEALRNEIAQWRAEAAKRNEEDASDDRMMSPADEIIDEESEPSEQSEVEGATTS